MKPATLLVVDDEPNICISLRSSLQSPTLEVTTACSAKEAWEIVRTRKIDAVLLDVRLPDMSGLDLFAQIHTYNARLPVIIMTAYSRTETAIEATRRGAFDYLVKPVDLRKLREVIAKALDVSRICSSPVVLSDSADDVDTGSDMIVGISPLMQEVYKTIGRVATQDATVLILGESGTGKELVARAIWNYSLRKDKTFLAINCAALPEALLESELFGHERGAFTGADQRRIGKFEKVNGGTIFLDEIGDMSAATQAKALRLLQQQQFERIGGNTTIQTDVRVIAATNRDLKSMVEANLFRRDLYYRFNGITIHLPSLRERLEDIPLLAKHCVRRLSSELGRETVGITQDAIERLQAHDWPGNVREFQSALRYAILHSTSDVLTADSLPESCLTSKKTSVAVPSLPVERKDGSHSTSESNENATVDITELAKQLLSSGKTNIYREMSSEVDKIILAVVMKHVGGNQVRAAEILGISRVTLRNKLRTLAAELPNDKGLAPEAIDDEV